MHDIITLISEFIWNAFLPILVVASILIWPKLIYYIKPKTTLPSKPALQQAIGPIAISLGAMVGTGAIVGVLGATNKLPLGVEPEAIAVWSLVGVIIMLPLIYSEVLVTKITNMSPKQYISSLVSPKLAMIYAYSFVLLYVFGFGGFQFEGIKEVVTTISYTQFDFDPSVMQQYIFIILPLFLFSSAIILTKKHNVFINVLTVMIVFAVIAYCVFLVAFTVSSGEFIKIYTLNMVDELLNPANAAFGLPIGLLLGLQRIIQTSEAGLGGLAMSSLESDSKPRAAGVIAMVPAVITIVIAILGTSYIASYGIYSGLVQPTNLNISTFLLIAHNVTGNIGVIIVILFTILSGLTTLIGSYYFLGVLLDYSENKNIAIYMLIIFSAGTLDAFGASLIFELIDLLLFVVTSINLIALYIFVKSKYKSYLLQ